MNIRPETPQDHSKIRQVTIAAFASDAEANLVEALRQSDASLISLVAEEQGEIAGHILFSPVTLDGTQAIITLAGLAPMAVAPSLQNRGIGSQLVEEGLRQCTRAGYGAVVVLGHPVFYSRFGFAPAVNHGIRSEYDVPEDVFMITELRQGALAGCAGMVKYHQAFHNL